jgi:hypothetical protein
MDNALTGLVDIEHLDTNGRRLGPQASEQFLSYLARAGSPARRRDGVVRRREGQFRIMDGKVAALKIQEAARTAEIVQQMAIDMEEIGIITDMRDDVLIPDFGQQRTAGLFQWPVLLLAFLADGIRRRPPLCTACYSGLSLAVSKHSRPLVG